jgi:murein DD-endopeptidase MepM/ murein hydrolase activator NlpD
MAPVPRQRPTADSTTYTIRKGDTLDAISKRTGISVPDLAVMNNIADPNKIYAGQKIRLGGILQKSTPPSGGKAATPLPRRSAANPLPSSRESRADRFAGVLDQLGMII